MGKRLVAYYTQTEGGPCTTEQLRLKWGNICPLHGTRRLYVSAHHAAHAKRKDRPQSLTGTG
ncbi:hypothetical protein P4S72_15620 [Vibrio sp. PP-XX7]